jgi:hypothetical protein
MIGEEVSLANFSIGSMEILIGILMCETPCGGPTGISISVISGRGAAILHDERRPTRIAKSIAVLCRFLEIID